MPGGWIVPEWPLPDGVRALCTTREGGISRSPFDTLNLGDHVGDDPLAVAANRAAFAAALQARPVFLQQIHGTRCVQLSLDTPDGMAADCCVTKARGIACTIMVADCMPVLFALNDGSAVAAAHAGWRGLAGSDGTGVLEAACRRLWSEGSSAAADTLVWLGPCIGPEAFEVGAEVKAAFEAGDPPAGLLFKPHGPGKWLADLPGLARRRLRALGITRIHGNDGSRGWCTVANPSRFFSYRRDGRLSGRMAASVWRV
jgi:YfiH family protein